MPNSKRTPAAIACWDFGLVEEWAALSPYAAFAPGHYNARPTDIFDLPQLGGRHFARSEPPSLAIASPIAHTEAMRTFPDRARDISVASAEIVQISNSRRGGSVGRACNRCAEARTSIARGLIPLPPPDARPLKPATAPPRLRIPVAILEESPLDLSPTDVAAFRTNIARNLPRNPRSPTPPSRIRSTPKEGSGMSK